MKRPSPACTWDITSWSSSSILKFLVKIHRAIMWLIPTPPPSNANQTCRLHGDTALRLAEWLLSGLCNSGASVAMSEASTRLMASWRCWTCRETPDTALEAQRGLLILRQMRSQLLLGRWTITISFSRKFLACVNVFFFFFFALAWVELNVAVPNLESEEWWSTATSTAKWLRAKSGFRVFLVAAKPLCCG